MSIYKRGKFYWYRFVWSAKEIRRSTKQGNDKVARQMEAAHRTALAKGEVGIREKKPAPTLKEFLEAEFRPYVKIAHALKPGTLRYYIQGCDMLVRSKIARIAVDHLTDQNARHFEAEYSELSPSGINRGLRTLRRALNLGYQWGRMDKPVRITLAKGEKQRERVLTDDELNTYLAACPQPWRDCATIIAEEGIRPGEVFELQWQHILLNEHSGLIRIADGKSKAARRVLPMTPNVYAVLTTRFDAAGHPVEGYVFPSSSADRHLTGNVAKDQHARALQGCGVTPFVPYILRHTALTNLAKKGADAHTLARIAGHSSIVITMRYVHPQADAIERVFAMAHGKIKQKRLRSGTEGKEGGVGTKLGTLESSTEKPTVATRGENAFKPAQTLETSGAGRGSRTPKVLSTGGF
jgi:integrase